MWNCFILTTKNDQKISKTLLKPKVWGIFYLKKLYFWENNKKKNRKFKL